MPFINCDKTGNDLTEVLDILENNSDLLLTGVDFVVDEINGYVDDGTLGLTQDVLDAITKVEDGIVGIIPDYTNRDNNIGDALERFDQDLAEFRELLKRCPQSKLREFLGDLALRLDLPDIDDNEFPFFGYSATREALRDLGIFPERYLQSVRQDILNNTKGGINELAGGLKDFLVGQGLDDLESLIPSKILDAAQRAEFLINCANSLVCSDLVQNIDRYNSIMMPLPLDPPFQTPSSNLARITKYKLDTPGILSTSNAGPGQITNLQNAKTSFTGAMDYARTLTSKF
jgi:hypothetical protein